MIETNELTLTDRVTAIVEAHASLYGAEGLAAGTDLRSVSTGDASLLSDTASLLAEMLDVDHWGAAKGTPGDKELSFWLCPSGRPRETERVEMLLPTQETSSLPAYTLDAEQLVVAPDIAGESRFADKTLLKLGMSSAVMSPLTLDERMFGVVGVLSSKPREFTREEALVVEAVSKLTASALARHQAESALESQNRFHLSVMESIEALVLHLTPDGRIVTFNRACQQSTGFTPLEITGRPMSSALLAAKDVPRVESVLKKLAKSDAPVKVTCEILTKHGEPRRVRWSFDALRDNEGRIESLLATGMDINQHAKVQQALDKIQAAAAESKCSLDELLTNINTGTEVLQSEKERDSRRGDGKGEGDRRQKSRRPYAHHQLVAPVIQGKTPQLDAFYSVLCRDISVGGLSFVLDEPPDHDSYVVALGAPPSLIYLKAEVMHTTALEIGGQVRSLVGCRYTGRVEY